MEVPLRCLLLHRVSMSEGVHVNLVIVQIELDFGDPKVFGRLRATFSHHQHSVIEVCIRYFRKHLSVVYQAGLWNGKV